MILNFFCFSFPVYQVVFHSQNLAEPAVISKLVGILNKNTGEIVQRRPRYVTPRWSLVFRTLPFICENKRRKCLTKHFFSHFVRQNFSDI